MAIAMSLADFTLPVDYRRIAVVHSFADLLATPLTGDVNAVCWRRALAGDFDEVVAKLIAGAGVTSIDLACLQELRVSARGRVAVETMLEDQRLLRQAGHAPLLECVREYARDDDSDGLPTDVFSFHVDSANAETDTFLCSYTGPASEGLRNDQAVRRCDVEQHRRVLLARFGGGDGPDFDAYLAQTSQDLHYLPVPGAAPFSFGVGNLWRLAVAHPGSAVPACIHRAPEEVPGGPPRLLLIS